MPINVGQLPGLVYLSPRGYVAIVVVAIVNRIGPKWLNTERGILKRKKTKRRYLEGYAKK